MNNFVKQYLAIKAKYPDAVVLFRVGDFYETFNEDAQILAKHMGVTLTSSEGDRQIKKGASLSHYWLDNALQKLVKSGHKVAICEELEAPKAGPVLRDVTDNMKPEPPLPRQRRFDF